MKQLFVYFLFLIFVASACRSSARFSTTNSTVHENSSNDSNTSKESSALNSFIKQWLYTPYKYGGMNKSGIDCSGFSTVVMREVYNITVPRTAGDQYNGGEKVRDGWRNPGDLVFFKNVRGQGVDHVGIYLGNNRFAHSSTSKGVIISDLDEDYYRKRYVGTCRYR